MDEIEKLAEEEKAKLAEEEKIRGKVDEKGNHWVKVYFGGGAHFRNWLEQAEEVGEVEVEEVSSAGLKCFEEYGEKRYRIWLKIPEDKISSNLPDELYSD